MSHKLLKNIAHSVLVFTMLAASFSYVLTGNLTNNTPKALADPPHFTCDDGSKQYGNDKATACAGHDKVKADMSSSDYRNMRNLLYFQECINSNINTSGSYKGWGDMFKDSGQIIVVGLDIDKGNGVQTCDTIAGAAIPVFEPKVKSGGIAYQQWLEDRLWGTNVSQEQSSSTIKVEPSRVKSQISKLNGALSEKIIALKKTGSYKNYALLRLKPLLTQCFKNWTNIKSDLNYGASDINLVPPLSVYAKSKTFGWDDVGYIKSKSGFYDSKNHGYVGDIQLGFITHSDVTDNLSRKGYFDNRASDWYPIGNDLPTSLVNTDDYGHRSSDENPKQNFLDCNWIQKHYDFLFSRSFGNEYYFNTTGANKDPEVFKVNATVDGDRTDTKADVPPEYDIAGGGGDGETGSKDYQCVVSPPLSWIACPVITLMVNALGALESGIVDSLRSPALTTDGAYQGLHDTWAGMRDVANVFLILIFLITIFAQVLPLDVDPYMVKKVLPKLIAAAILIQFSYFFVQILFDMSGVLGAGVKSIINSIPAPQSGGGIFGENVGEVTAASTFASIGAVATGAAGVAAAFAVGTALVVPILLLLLSALISVITLFVTLQMRMIVLIMFTVVAPLAFLAWILPNTESYFKKWSTGLIKLLLMYPLIVFMIESANLISKISYAAVSTTDSGGTVSGITQLMISIIPIIIYFMIPMTFKWAGGIFASVSGAIQNQGGKLGKRARSGTLMKNAMQDLKDKGAIKLLNTTDKPGSFGRLGARVATGNAFSFGASGRKKIRKTQEEAQSKLNELQQDEYRNVQNAPLMKELVEEVLDAKGNGTGVFRLKKGQTASETLSKLDLIAGRGGTLELADYFAALENEGKVTRGAKGGVEHVDDEIWGQLAKKHGPAIAAALPHTTGKAMQSQDGAGLNKSKGVQPARELEREFKTMDAGAKQMLMQQFFDASQRDDAGSMDKAMVKALERMASDPDAMSTVFTMSDGKTTTTADAFFKRQIANGRMNKFVQPS